VHSNVVLVTFRLSLQFSSVYLPLRNLVYIQA